MQTYKECGGEIMQLSTAINVLTKRAEDFYGKSFDWLIDEMDKSFQEVGYVDENQKVTQAYKVYKNWKMGSGATPLGSTIGAGDYEV